MEDAKHLDGFLGGGFVAVDGHSGVDDLLHAPAYASYVVKGNGASDVQIDVVAVGDGNVNGHLTLFVEFVNGFAEHEEERACIGSGTTGGGHVEEFHFLLFIDAEVHSFHFIIHSCTNRSVLHFET